MNTMVISRYREDVSWADNVNPKFIVQKGEHVPNVGKEASSYLWYIVNNYDTLEGMYQFRQAQPYDHLISVPDHKEPLEYIQQHIDIKKFIKKFDIHIPNPEKIQFTAGAQFDIKATHIKHRPLSFYKELYEISVGCDYVNVEHIFERLWGYIFEINWLIRPGIDEPFPVLLYL